MAITSLNYLDPVQFVDESDAIHIRQHITRLLFGSITQERLEAFISEKMNTKQQSQTKHQSQTKQQSQARWQSCNSWWNGCDWEILNRLAEIEIASTAGILRFLSTSVLGKGAPFFKFRIRDLYSLSGLWVEDKWRIELVLNGDVPSEHQLIAGLGPSASGKTYIAKEILQRVLELDPAKFLSIDGGSYRENSIIYRLILAHMKADGVYFTNLSDRLPSASIFNGDMIKEAIVDYLLEKKYHMSLYVPETLGSCWIPEKCSSPKKFLKKYMTITNNEKWITLLIWQHKTAADCIFKNGFKCSGCTASGQRRQTVQGKKYNPDAYSTSMEYGQSFLSATPGRKFRIHNTGTAAANNKIIVEEFKANFDSKKIKDTNLYVIGSDLRLKPGDAGYETFIVKQLQTVDLSIKIE